MKRDHYVTTPEMDWQDKVVTRACLVVFAIWLLTALLPV